METEEAKQFLEEREAKLGKPIIYKVYATWFAEVGRERRDFGVFVYSDGETLVIEDFFRPATVLGYGLATKREKERERNYVKMDLRVPVASIREVTYVSRSSAEAALRNMEDCAKESNLFHRLFTKNATCVRADGRTFFFELPSHKEFKAQFSKL